MNVNPSDTDVRQGYALAEGSPASQAGSGATQNAAAGKVDTANQSASPAQNTAAAQTDSSAQADSATAYSKAVQATADKTTAKEAAQKLGEQLQASDTGLKIRVLDDTQHTVQVEIFDEKSKKVLRQIPQDEMLKLSASMREMTGVLLNKPA